MTGSSVGIIGAGPAGLAAAYCLARQGVRVEVFEAGNTVGGMSRTFELWGQKVDLGPHRFFSADARVNRLWLDVAAGDYRMVERQTRIFYGGKFFHYPLRLGDALAKLGPVEAVLCVGSYLRERCRWPSPGTSGDDSFEHWVRGRFGQRLYDCFFRVYSEKLWGIPCSRLDADFAAQRIRKLSFFEAILNALRQGRNNTHATLVDRFAYPLGGTGSIYARMAGAVCAAGGSVHLSTPVRAVLPDAGAGPGIALADGREHRFGHVISTMPLTHMLAALPAVPAAVRQAAAQLRFRNTIVVYLRVEANDLFPDQWIYVHSPELAVGRITNFRNWVPELYGNSEQTILALELWCNADDELWRAPDARHIALATEDLRRTGLAGNAAISAGHVVKVPYCYPVYDLGYRRHVAVLRGYLQTLRGVSLIGRYGSFKYNNQDHSLLMGILAAENIVAGASHDLWNVNTGDEYQEAAIISETGLVPQSS